MYYSFYVYTCDILAATRDAAKCNFVVFLYDDNKASYLILSYLILVDICCVLALYYIYIYVYICICMYIYIYILLASECMF